MQFGKAFDNIIKKVSNTHPQHGIVNLSKYDLADVVVRVGLSPSMILKLAVAIPLVLPKIDYLIAVHMVLLMGCMESLPIT
jgi:hypothetical protein